MHWPSCSLSKQHLSILHQGPDSALPPFCFSDYICNMFWCFTLIKATVFYFIYTLWKWTSWGEKICQVDWYYKIISTFHTHTLIRIQGNRDILPVRLWLYRLNEPPACPCFCPAICKALWDMTNGVLCLKDCGVWCECSLGRGEVNYLGLNSYFVPLQGSSQQTGEESDASWTGCISRSLWTKQHLWFISFFLYLPASTFLCVSLISAWLKSSTHFTRAIGHQHVPMWRCRKLTASSLLTLWRQYSLIYYFTRQFTSFCFQTFLHGVFVKKEKQSFFKKFFKNVGIYFLK